MMARERRRRKEFSGGGNVASPAYKLIPHGYGVRRRLRRSGHGEIEAHGEGSAGRPDRHARRKVTEAKLGGIRFAIWRSAMHRAAAALNSLYDRGAAT